MPNDARAALTEEYAELLAEHEDCTMNDGDVEPGVDVWSCGIRLPFVDDLDDAGRLHFAAALAARVAVAQAEAWDEGRNAFQVDNPYHGRARGLRGEP